MIFFKKKMFTQPEGKKMIVVSKETHSLLFSVKSQMVMQAKKTLTFDEVIQQLINLHSINSDDKEFQLQEAEQLERERVDFQNE